jgi:hypothetical protein
MVAWKGKLKGKAWPFHSIGSCCPSLVVAAPPLPFAVVMMVDILIPVRRGQSAQPCAANASDDQGAAKRIIAQQIASIPQFPRVIVYPKMW